MMRVYQYRKLEQNETAFNERLSSCVLTNVWLRSSGECRVLLLFGEADVSARRNQHLHTGSVNVATVEQRLRTTTEAWSREGGSILWPPSGERRHT